jgi:enoyl-CoA hydratase/carnithine racemase
MRFKTHQDTLTLILDQQQTANALSWHDSQELAQHLKKPWKLILCVGQDSVFCSGGQLKDYAKLKTREQGLKINQQIQKNLDKLEKHQALKVAFVGGDCFGGGIEFLGCFDLIYSAPHVFYGFWQNRMGVSYGWGGYKRLQKKVSAEKLKIALLEESLLTSHQMKQWGLVNEIIDSQEFVSRMAFWSSQQTKSKSKQEIQKNIDKNADAVFKKLWGGEEHKKSLQKFLKNK